MATIVCHQHRGLQSCLESHTVEPVALRLTLSSSRPYFSPSSLELASKSVSVNSSPELGGWSLLQTLFDGPRLSKEIEGNENTYTHSLSDKSLELCTENLGSETGSDDVLEDENDIFSLSSSRNRQSENLQTWKQHESRQVLGGKKAIGGDFPPPLTTINGSESIRVRSHRENGRLVIKAEKSPYNNSIFRAERSNGRLRLCILKEETTTDKENDNNNNHNEDGEEKIENDSNPIAEKEELENGKEMETTKLERREGRDGRGGGGGGGRCKGGEHEEQMIYSGFACVI
ncbi:hypothetical protein HRI_003270100 [Hibiscus trionum]|uniref:FAF domain-containing protein n=1 Tax=Hibiscus trionum TaxID=183268 RepID=A0A9W7IKX7_HIBTR|nr:hypothetical protein HRI_003270100 [Hibiscus trionum]